MDIRERFLTANEGNPFFAAAALGVALASDDPSDPLRAPYSVKAAAIAAARVFPELTESQQHELERAISIGIESEV